jgi:transcriptional regulator with XRE-family HTH domain
MTRNVSFCQQEFVPKRVTGLRAVHDTIRVMAASKKPSFEPPSEAQIHSGRRLRAARIVLKFGTVESFANALGVSRTAMSNWENGSRLPDVFAMVRLWDRWGIPLEWIFAGSLRGVPYEMGDDLKAAAAEVGAAVGGIAPEWPTTSSHGPTARPPAAIPRRRPRTMLHEAAQLPSPPKDH